MANQKSAFNESDFELGLLVEIGDALTVMLKSKKVKTMSVNIFRFIILCYTGDIRNLNATGFYKD